MEKGKALAIPLFVFDRTNKLHFINPCNLLILYQNLVFAKESA
jgi:hypothetical protein